MKRTEQRLDSQTLDQDVTPWRPQRAWCILYEGSVGKALSLGTNKAKLKCQQKQGTLISEAFLKYDKRESYLNIVMKGLALSEKSKRYKGIRKYKYTYSEGVGLNST